MKSLKTKASKLFKHSPAEPSDEEWARMVERPKPVPDDHDQFSGGIESDNEDRVVSNIRLCSREPKRKTSRFGLRTKASRLFSGPHSARSSTFGGGGCSSDVSAVSSSSKSRGPPPPRPVRPNDDLDEDLVKFMRSCDVFKRGVVPCSTRSKGSTASSVTGSSGSAPKTSATASTDVNSKASAQENVEENAKAIEDPFADPNTEKQEDQGPDEIDSLPKLPSTSKFPSFQHGSFPSTYDGRDSHTLAEYYRTARSSTNCSITPSMSISARFRPSHPGSNASITSIAPPPVPEEMLPPVPTIPSLESLARSHTNSTASAKSLSSLRPSAPLGSQQEAMPRLRRTPVGSTISRPSNPLASTNSALLASAPTSALSNAESASTSTGSRAHSNNTGSQSLPSSRNSANMSIARLSSSRNSLGISVKAGRTGFPLSYMDAVDRMSCVTSHLDKVDANLGRVVLEGRKNYGDPHTPAYQFISYSGGGNGMGGNGRRGMTFRDEDGFIQFVPDI